MRGSIRPGFALLLFVVFALALSFGCGERIHGDAPANQPPRIALSAGPPEGDPDSGYRIHFYWHRWTASSFSSATIASPVRC